MGQAGEQRALARKPLRATTVEGREVQQFHGDGTVEAAVAAPRAPDSAHAAAAERRLQGIGADGGACQSVGWRQGRRLQERRAHQPVVVVEQFGQDGGIAGVAGAEALEPVRAIRG